MANENFSVLQKILAEAVEKKDSLIQCVKNLDFIKMAQGERVDTSSLGEKDREIISIIEQKA